MFRRTRPAFTLIEVLVVVAIIALLVAVLVPSLSAARDSAQTVVCKTRLGELYKGHLYYAHDSKQFFPHFDWWLWDGYPTGTEPQLLNNPTLYAKTGGVRASDSRVWVRYGQIYRYMKERESYFCPKDSKRRNGGIGARTADMAIHSYARCFEPHYFALWQKTGKSFSQGSWPFDGKIDSTDFLRIDQITTGMMGNSMRLHTGVPATTTADRVGLLFEEWQTADDVLKSAAGDIGYSDLNDGYSAPMLSAGDHITTRHSKNRGHILYWDGHSGLVEGVRLNLYPAHYDTGTVPADKRYAAVVLMGASKQ